MHEPGTSRACRAPLPSRPRPRSPRAPGHVGDGRTVDALVGMMTDDELTDRARGFAAVVLGLISDPAHLPWNARLSVDLNYRAACETLDESSGTGILNIL